MATLRQRGPNNPELLWDHVCKEERDAMKDYDKVDIESYLRSISYDLESDYLDGLEAERERILAPRASKPSSRAELNESINHMRRLTGMKPFLLVCLRCQREPRLRRARQRRLWAWRMSLLTTTIHQQFRARTAWRLTRS
jgi:hypothetical protein